MATKARTPRKSPGAEYRFRIDAYTPENIPMARLAQYMGELAALLGEQAAVHFLKLERGSTVIVHAVEREAIPKVKARTDGLRDGAGTQDAARAFDTINRFLREDNATGELRDRQGKTAKILYFPGRLQTPEKFTSVKQHGSIDGVINSIGGKDETVHIRLEQDGQQLSGCYTSRAIAKELRHLLFEPVRLFGRGRWNRDDDGNWTLSDFKIESFEPLSGAPLSDALALLRAIPTEWTDESYSQLGEIRKGTKGAGNGGH